LLRGTQAGVESVTGSGLYSAQSLQSSLIEKTVYGGVYARTCPRPAGNDPYCVTDGPEKKTIGWIATENPKDLPICSTTGLGRFTYESVALTSAYVLQNAYSVINSAATSLKIPRITLNILPVFSTTRVNRDGVNGRNFDEIEYLTDNLFYFPGIETISVQPQSEAAYEQKLQPFWESAFALTHEFGHHIEHQILKRVSTSQSLRWDPFEHRYTFSFENNAHGLDQTQTLSRVWTAISEAFADKTALYLQKGNTLSLVGLPYINIDRDPLIAHFRDNQTQKIISKSHADAILSGREANTTKVRVDQPHTFGAIIAFSVNTFLSTIVGWKDGINLAHAEELNHSELMRLNSAWFEAVASEALVTFNEQGSSLDLEFLPRALNEVVVNNVDSNDKALLEKLCQQKTELWPHLSNPAFCRHF